METLNDLDINDFYSDDIVLINSSYYDGDDYSFFRESEWTTIKKMYDILYFNGLNLTSDSISIYKKFSSEYKNGVYFHWLDNDIDKKFGQYKPLSKYEKEKLIVELINKPTNNIHIGCLRKELKDKWIEFIYYYNLCL